MLIQSRIFAFITLLSASFVSNSRHCSSLCHCFLPFTPANPRRELCTFTNCHAFPWAAKEMWAHMTCTSCKQDEAHRLHAKALGAFECVYQSLFFSFKWPAHHSLWDGSHQCCPGKGATAPPLAGRNIQKHEDSAWKSPACLSTTGVLPSHAMLFSLNYHPF